MEHWGTIIWRFLHVIVNNIDENTFHKNKCNIIDCINYIGNNLPCGICSMHYKKNNMINSGDIFHKNGLITKIWEIHNNVKKSRNIKPYSIDV